MQKRHRTCRGVSNGEGILRGAQPKFSWGVSGSAHVNIILDFMRVCALSFWKYHCSHRSPVAALVLLTTMLMSPLVGLLRAAPPVDADKSSTVAVIYDSQPDPRVDSYIHALFLRNLLTHFDLRAALIPLDEYRPGQLVGLPCRILDRVRAENRRPVRAAFRHSRHRPAVCLAGWTHRSTPCHADARRQYGFSFVEYDKDVTTARSSTSRRRSPNPSTI